MVVFIQEGDSVTLPPTEALSKEKAVAFLSTKTTETKQSVHEKCMSDYYFCASNVNTCMNEEGFEQLCGLCSIFQTCYVDGPATPSSFDNWIGNINYCGTRGPTICHYIPNFHAGIGLFTSLMVLTVIALVLLISCVVLWKKFRATKQLLLTAKSKNEENGQKDNKVNKPDETEIKRRPEVVTEQVIVPDESYPLQVSSVKRYQVAPARNLKDDNVIDDQEDDLQSVAPVSTEYKRTGNRRYVKTPRYGRMRDHRIYSEQETENLPSIQLQPTVQDHTPVHQQYRMINVIPQQNYNQDTRSTVPQSILQDSVVGRPITLTLQTQPTVMAAPQPATFAQQPTMIQPQLIQQQTLPQVIQQPPVSNNLINQGSVVVQDTGLNQQNTPQQVLQPTLVTQHPQDTLVHNTFATQPQQTIQQQSTPQLTTISEHQGTTIQNVPAVQPQPQPEIVATTDYNQPA